MFDREREREFDCVLVSTFEPVKHEIYTSGAQLIVGV